MLTEIEAKARILIVDDEPFVRNILLKILSDSYECIAANSAEEALSLLQAETFNLILSDIQMPGISGLEMIPQIIELAPDICIIMISGLNNIENAIQAMRAGAFDYITKPFVFDHVEASVRRAVEHELLKRTKKHYENHLEELVAARTAELRQEIVVRERAEAQIIHDAFHDSLTGFANRTLFIEHLHLTIERGKRSLGAAFAVLLLDLDRFKIINDSLGHSAGDEVLKLIGERLEKFLRPGDLIARLGGDEFAILLNAVDDEREALRIAERIQEDLKSPLNLNDQDVFTSVSIGIVLSTNESTSAGDILRDADTAMYRAKANGKAQYQVFDRTMHERAFGQLKLETEIRQALDRNEFLLHYQPIIKLDTNELVGFEALVRWNHPTRGMVPPIEFI